MGASVVILVTIIFIWCGFRLPARGHEYEIHLGHLLLSICIIGTAVRRAQLRKSLSPAGIGMAIFLTLPIFVKSLTTGLALVTFFFAADRATRFGIEHKSPAQGRLAVYTKPHQQCRGANQVLANALVPAGFSVLAILSGSAVGPRLLVAARGAVCGAAADTLASEMAPVLWPGLPRTILPPWSTVPVGSNGGVTLIGFLLSFMGGCLPLIPLVILRLVQPQEVIIGGLAGFLGSLLDSVLGACFEAAEETQPSWKKPLDNDDVNLLCNMAAATVALTLHGWRDL
eukprot:Protomagalhaensia_wolfi_Nauph_80__1078@NODE_162_length_3369_cov_163_069069_g123_i0_p1_GENE_NODE_162_length_3369_cov_163_069069_g123_i0NODE_162_length_3369_cov_163_069069_g123_i0_p1_ORF_typecomplete_len285_score39_73DUF92/PF01940_16/4e42_NODE_162_length_3369_cov_163_069069_g123_i023363190